MVKIKYLAEFRNDGNFCLFQFTILRETESFFTPYLATKITGTDYVVDYTINRARKKPSKDNGIFTDNFREAIDWLIDKLFNYITELLMQTANARDLFAQLTDLANESNIA